MVATGLEFRIPMKFRSITQHNVLLMKMKNQYLVVWRTQIERCARTIGYGAGKDFAVFHAIYPNWKWACEGENRCGKSEKGGHEDDLFPERDHRK